MFTSRLEDEKITIDVLLCDGFLLRNTGNGQVVWIPLQLCKCIINISRNVCSGSQK